MKVFYLRLIRLRSLGRLVDPSGTVFQLWFLGRAVGGVKLNVILKAGILHLLALRRARPGLPGRSSDPSGMGVLLLHPGQVARGRGVNVKINLIIEVEVLRNTRLSSGPTSLPWRQADPSGTVCLLSVAGLARTILINIKLPMRHSVEGHSLLVLDVNLCLR